MIKKNAMQFMVFSMIMFQLLIPGYPVRADDPKARATMQKVEDLDMGDNEVSEIEMILIDKRGKQRIRKLKVFAKYKGKDRYSIRFFLHPADVKGTGFLVYDYSEADKDDDQWLYMPALGKVKRVASADQSGSFMGSDLNYSDMITAETEDYDYTLLKEDEVRGEKVWVIQAIPRNQKTVEETGYTKTIFFVSQDNYVPVRFVRWVNKSSKLKYFDVTKLELIDGIWVRTELHVTTKKGKRVEHKTILKRSNTRFNQNLDDVLFTGRQLEKGIE